MYCIKYIRLDNAPFTCSLMLPIVWSFIQFIQIYCCIIEFIWIEFVKKSEFRFDSRKKFDRITELNHFFRTANRIAIRIDFYQLWFESLIRFTIWFTTSAGPLWFVVSFGLLLWRVRVWAARPALLLQTWWQIGHGKVGLAIVSGVLLVLCPVVGGGVVAVLSCWCW
jgi:hypothetical protein